MIIESAFYKLPDYFLTKETPELDYESQLVTYFVLSIFLELQNRGINTPYLNIQLEKKYPKKNYCLLYTSPSPRDISGSRMPSSA